MTTLKTRVCFGVLGSLILYAVFTSSLWNSFFPISNDSLLHHAQRLVPRAMAGFPPSLSRFSSQVQYVTPQLLPCDWSPQTILRPHRSQCYVTCNVSTTTIAFREVPSDVTPSLTSLPNDTSCLKRVIAQHCNCCGRRIPRIVHYVRYGSFNLTLDAFISVLSVARFVKPCLIVFHGDSIPHGPYWRALLHLVPNLVHKWADKPTQIFGHPIKVVEHSADVKRLQLMIDYGGVYLDGDHMVLRSLDDLLREHVVMGYETVNANIGNGFLLSEPNATFMRTWLNNYTDFNDSVWGQHSVFRPYRIYLDHPDLAKVVGTFFKPNWALMAAFYDRQRVPEYDWSHHYGLHFYTRLFADQFYRERVDKQDNVIGDMVRHVLYGDRHACKPV